VKTISLKKVSAVAVASLAFGTFTAIAPAQAAMTSFTISKNSASSGVIKCSQSLTSNASTTITAGGGVCLSDALTPAGTGVWAPGDSGFFGKILTNTTAGGGTAATLTAASPAQAVVPLAFYTGVVASTTVPTGVVADTISGMTTTTGAAGLLLLTLDGTITGTAGKARMTIGGTVIGASDVTGVATDTRLVIPFTAPVAAGTYTASVQVSVGGSYTGTGADTFTQPFTLTVTAATTLSTALSTAFMTEPTANGASASSTTNGVARSAYKTKDTGIAQIKVTLLKADGTADTATHTITATVSGAGFVSADQTPNVPGSVATRTASVSTGGNAGVNYIHINSDGTAGSGTVTVTVTHNVTGVTTTLGTFSYTSYDDVTALAVSTTIATIGKAGSTTGGSSATRTASELGQGVLTSGTTIPAFIVKATDSAGRVANTVAAPSVVSLTSPAVATGGTCTKDGGVTSTSADTPYKSSTNGVGFYNCNFATFSGAKSGEKATLTIRIVDPADATKFISTTFDVTVGGSVSTEVLSFDKTAYAPGEGMVITRTAKDSSGNPVPDGTASPAVTFSKAVGGSVSAGFYRLGASATSTSAANATVFAPVIGGAFNALATSSATGAPTITATASVTDANAALLTQIDALNAKIVALNALIAKIMKKLGVK